MDRLHRAIKSVHRLDDLAARHTPLTRLHPLAKLAGVLVYLIVTLSFPKYALTGLLGMGLYPLVLYELDDLSLWDTLRQARGILLLLAAVGVFNLFFDRAPVLALGPLVLSGGWVSLATLLLKGAFSFLAVYLLIATTGMERLCAALVQLHVPQVLVTTILLTYRYIVLLLQEGNRISTAYALRAPGQKGIHFRAWGSLLGQLLLRSIDRAQLVYESMQLRGYGYKASLAREGGGPEGRGELAAATQNASDNGNHLPHPLRGSPLASEGAFVGSALFAIFTLIYCLIFRTIPVFELIGNLL